MNDPEIGMVRVRPPDDMRQLSIWFDRGVTHFLKSVHTPDRMGSEYPTRDTHTEEQETDFIAGFNQAKAMHEAAKHGDYIEVVGVDERFGWRVE